MGDPASNSGAACQAEWPRVPTKAIPRTRLAAGRGDGTSVSRSRPTVSFVLDFAQRSRLARAALTNLIRIRAFDALGLNRRELIWQLGLLAGGFEQAELRRARDRQLRMPLPTQQDAVALRDFNAAERMGAGLRAAAALSGQPPMQFLGRQLGEGVMSSRHLRAMPAGRRVDLTGLVVCRQPPLTARGDRVPLVGG